MKDFVMDEFQVNHYVNNLLGMNNTTTLNFSVPNM